MLRQAPQINSSHEPPNKDNSPAAPKTSTHFPNAGACTPTAAALLEVAEAAADLVAVADTPRWKVGVRDDSATVAAVALAASAVLMIAVVCDGSVETATVVVMAEALRSFRPTIALMSVDPVALRFA